MVNGCCWQLHLTDIKFCKLLSILVCRTIGKQARRLPCLLTRWQDEQEQRFVWKGAQIICLDHEPGREVWNRIPRESAVSNNLIPRGPHCLYASVEFTGTWYQLKGASHGTHTHGWTPGTGLRLSSASLFTSNTPSVAETSVVDTGLIGTGAFVDRYGQVKKRKTRSKRIPVAPCPPQMPLTRPGAELGPLR